MLAVVINVLFFCRLFRQTAHYALLLVAKRPQSSALPLGPASASGIPRSPKPPWKQGLPCNGAAQAAAHVL